MYKEIKNKFLPTFHWLLSLPKSILLHGNSKKSIKIEKKNKIEKIKKNSILTKLCYYGDWFGWIQDGVYH